MPKSRPKTSVSDKPQKTPRFTPIAGKNGGTLVAGAGNGPPKGEGGRPPNWWKERMTELRDRFLIAAEAKGIMDDPDHPRWAEVGKWAHEQLEGRAKQTVDVNATISVADKLTEARQRALQRGVIDVDAKLLDSGEALP